jgi:protein-tyrosine-phosphatase
MASALLLNKWQEINKTVPSKEIRVWSAGLFAQNDLPASPQAIEVLREKGIDMSLHRSSSLRASHVNNADLILTMTVSQRDIIADRFPDKRSAIYTLGEFAGYADCEVLDPYGKDLDAYRESLSQLQLIVDRLSSKIIELDLRCYN